MRIKRRQIFPTEMKNEKTLKGKMTQKSKKVIKQVKKKDKKSSIFGSLSIMLLVSEMKFLL